LNSRDLDVNVKVTSTVPVDVMVKRYGSAMYVFAVAMKNDLCTATFAVPELAESSVEVIGENRTLPISAGQFQDSFVGYGPHIYKITN
jgi:hypothetical protein